MHRTTAAANSEFASALTSVVAATVPRCSATSAAESSLALTRWVATHPLTGTCAMPLMIIESLVVFRVVASCGLTLQMHVSYLEAKLFCRLACTAIGPPERSNIPAREHPQGHHGHRYSAHGTRKASWASHNSDSNAIFASIGLALGGQALADQREFDTASERVWHSTSGSRFPMLFVVLWVMQSAGAQGWTPASKHPRQISHSDR